MGWRFRVMMVAAMKYGSRITTLTGLCDSRASRGDALDESLGLAMGHLAHHGKDLAIFVGDFNPVGTVGIGENRVRPARRFAGVPLRSTRQVSHV